MKKIVVLLLGIFCLTGDKILAQAQVPLSDALNKITKVYGTRFVYERAIVEGKITTVEVADQKTKPVEDVLKSILYPNDLLFLYVDLNHYTIVKRDEKNISVPATDSEISPNIETSARRTITGRVVSANNAPLSDISISARKAGTGTTTGADGSFSLAVENNDILDISSVGYASQEITVTSQTVLNIVLQTRENELEQVVVVAYGSQNKKDLTGSVSTISGEALSELPPTINVEQALQGRAAGVMVVQESGQPGSATRVRIRGSSSLLGSNQPLYVVDGIPVIAEGNIPDDGSAFNNELLQQGLSSPLANINPADIESISILKDASATAIYGSRAANGVVIITTKKGRGKLVYNLNSSLSFQKVQTEDMLNAQQFREIWTEAAMNSTSTAAIVQDIKNGTYFHDANTSWRDEITPANPLTKNLNFSISGATDKVRYYTSVSTQNQEGSFQNSYFNRYSFLVNLNFDLSERLTMGTSINLSSSKQGSPDDGLLARIYSFRPDLPVFDSAGNYSFSDYHNSENPVALATATNVNQTKMMLGSVYGDFKIAEGLILKSSLALNYNQGDFSSFYPSHTFTGGFSRAGRGPGFAKQSSSEFLSHLWENTLTYKKRINNHNIDAVVGAAWQGDTRSSLSASGKGFPQDVTLTDLTSATQDFIIGSNKIQSGLISYFGRINYQYDNRYMLSFSARTDGSSKFAEENKWAFFPTVAGAWRISQEKFFENVKFISDLKLRASTGLTGLQNFGAYQWRTLFAASNYGGMPAVIQNQLGNSELKWELTRQTDIGLDFSLFNSRVNGAFDVYEKNTSDLLYFYITPGNTGFISVIGNLGKTQNRGIELSLDGDIIRNQNFTWNMGVNISRNRNKLVSLNDDYLNKGDGFITPPNTGSRLKIGEPIGLIYGYVAEGIIQTQAELDALNAGSSTGAYQAAATAPGDIKFKDLDGDGRVTAVDQEIIGNALPDLSGGITSVWAYKGLRLSALFTYSVGNDIRWGTQSQAINFSSAALENKMTMVLDRWTPENPSDLPRVVYGDPNGNAKVSSFYVHDGSYMRLKNLHLSYSLDDKLISRIGFIRSAMFYLSGTNLLTFTKYPGANPETSNLYNDDVSAGLDNSRFPISKVFTVGASIGF